MAGLVGAQQICWEEYGWTTFPDGFVIKNKTKPNLTVVTQACFKEAIIDILEFSDSTTRQVVQGEVHRF